MLPIHLVFLRQGCADLDAIASFSGVLVPSQVVDLFDAAVRGCDGSIIERLLLLFGMPEFPAAPLCHAIAQGNGSAARVLLSHGAELSAKLYVPDQVVPDSTSSSRLSRYLEHSLECSATDSSPDVALMDEIRRCHKEAPLVRFCAATLEGFAYRLCITQRGAPLVVELARKGLFNGQDLWGLCLALALAERFGDARALLEAGAQFEEGVAVACLRPGEERLEPSRVSGIGDLLFPGCSRECAAFVCAEAPETVSSRWSDAFLDHDPEVIRTLFAHLCEEYVGDVGRLLSVLAANGFVREVSQILAWDGTQDPGSLQRALEAAADAQRFETCAVLIEHKRAMDRNGGNLAPAIPDL